MVSRDVRCADTSSFLAAHAVALLGLGIAASSACSEDPSGTRAAEPWSTALPRHVSIPTPPPRVEPPHSRVAHSFPRGMAFFAVGPAVIACARGCLRERLESAPDTWVVTGDTSTKRAALFPDEPKGRRYIVEYRGAYPDSLETILAVGTEQEGMEERIFSVNTAGARPKFTRQRRQQNESLRHKFREASLHDPRDLAAYRAYLAEEVEASAADAPQPGIAIGGHGGPLLALNSRHVIRWDATRWFREVAPWQYVLSGVRLTNGASFVLSSRTIDGQSVERLELYWISPTGEIHPTPIRPIDGLLANVVEMNRQVWLHVESKDGAHLLAPAQPNEASLPSVRTRALGEVCYVGSVIASSLPRFRAARELEASTEARPQRLALMPPRSANGERGTLVTCVRGRRSPWAYLQDRSPWLGPGASSRLGSRRPGQCGAASPAW